MKVSTDGVLFGSWVNYAGAERILDIGTGTGVLAASFSWFWGGGFVVVLVGFGARSPQLFQAVSGRGV